MARRSRAEQGDTLQDISRAAFTLFGKHGFDGVSVGMVAAQAGITKAALYWHFDNKAALYTHCLRELHTLFERHVFRPMLKETDPAEQLLLLFAGIVRLVRDPRIRGGVAGYWLEASTDKLTEARKLQGAFEAAAATLLAASIERAIAQQKMHFDIPAEQMARAVTATMESIILPLRHQSVAQSVQLVVSLGHTFFKACASDTNLPQRALQLGHKPSH